MSAAPNPHTDSVYNTSSYSISDNCVEIMKFYGVFYVLRKDFYFFRLLFTLYYATIVVLFD